MAPNPQWTREAVRKRPGMYVGSTSGAGILHLAFEILGNAVDLVLAGAATSIEVNCHGDGSIEVSDDGPGLDLSSELVRRYFEVPRNNPTADGHTPHVHLAAFGVGLWVVNVLSERLLISSTYGNGHAIHEWTGGGAEHRVLDTAPTPSSMPRGTSVRFWPDPLIFGTAQLKPEQLLDRLNELKQLIPELSSTSFTHTSPDTNRDGLASLIADSRISMPEPVWRHETSIDGADGTPIMVDILIALSGLEKRPEIRRSEIARIFCNYREVTDESGVHRAIRSALGAPDDEPLSGLIAVCNLRMLSLQFNGPTRAAVDDPVAVEAIATAVSELLEANPDARSAANEMTNPT